MCASGLRFGGDHHRNGDRRRDDRRGDGRRTWLDGARPRVRELGDPVVVGSHVFPGVIDARRTLRGVSVQHRRRARVRRHRACQPLQSIIYAAHDLTSTKQGKSADAFSELSGRAARLSRAPSTVSSDDSAEAWTGATTFGCSAGTSAASSSADPKGPCPPSPPVLRHRGRAFRVGRSRERLPSPCRS